LGFKILMLFPSLRCTSANTIMPGRQSHGRPLLPVSAKKPQGSRLSTKKTRANALNAFTIAADEISTTPNRTRTRGEDAEPSDRTRKRQRASNQEEEQDDDDDDAQSDVPEQHRKKRTRNQDEDFDIFSGSDSDGHEWHEGLNSGDDDSDIDSDAAFGDSDEEAFEGYAFRGSSTKNQREESDPEDDESLGSDAIDLAQALDQFSEDESEQNDSGSSDDESGGTSSGSEDTSDEDSDSDGDEPSGNNTLKRLIAGFGDDKEDEDEEDGDHSASRQKPKLSFKDLGLLGIKDQQIKKSMKLMAKEDKAAKSTSSKKLDVPLPRRQQDGLLRKAAYEKTSETLDRWTETVKQNRRADHLVFPLAQNAEDAGLHNLELVPLTQKRSGTELENTILAIMEESGLGPTSKPPRETKVDGVDAEGEIISKDDMAELKRQQRRDRELHSREQARAKRIKKVKSKAYRRIHRKERLRDEDAIRQQMIESGEIDSEAERESQDMRRAMERMGAKHRESKWAKLGKKAGRAVWDENFRAGLTDMARRQDELRRRVDGDHGSANDDSEDSISDSESGEEGGQQRLLNQLEKAAAYDDGEPESKLMKMKFMQKGEAARKLENDQLVKELRRELDGGRGSDSEDEADQDAEVGRRRYGAVQQGAVLPAGKTFRGARNHVAEVSGVASVVEKPPGESMFSNPSQRGSEAEILAPSTAGAWSSAGKQRKSKTKAPRTQDIDLSQSITSGKKKPSSLAVNKEMADDNLSGDDDDAVHLPVTMRDSELLKRAFAGADVAGDFESEKRAAVEQDDEKEQDNTLPGWGSWVGEGVSKREAKKHAGRFITKIAGVKPKDRKDFRLERVIMNEKRVKKVRSPPQQAGPVVSKC
jgi:U3 small nucleolar RNA-associated protein 14